MIDDKDIAKVEVYCFEGDIETKTDFNCISFDVRSCTPTTYLKVKSSHSLKVSVAKFYKYGKLIKCSKNFRYEIVNIEKNNSKYGIKTCDIAM